MTHRIKVLNKSISLHPLTKGKTRPRYFVISAAEVIADILDQIPAGPVVYLPLAANNYPEERIRWKIQNEVCRYRPDVTVYHVSGKRRGEILQELLDIEPVAIFIGSGNLLYLAEQAEDYGLEGVFEKLLMLLPDTVFVGIGAGGMWFGMIDGEKISAIEPSHGKRREVKGLHIIPYHIALHIDRDPHAGLWKPVLSNWSENGVPHILVKDGQHIVVHDVWVTLQKRLSTLKKLQETLCEELDELSVILEAMDIRGSRLQAELDLIYVRERIEDLNIQLSFIRKKRINIQRDILIQVNARKSKPRRKQQRKEGAL